MKELFVSDDTITNWGDGTCDITSYSTFTLERAEGKYFWMDSFTQGTASSLDTIPMDPHDRAFKVISLNTNVVVTVKHTTDSFCNIFQEIVEYWCL